MAVRCGPWCVEAKSPRFGGLRPRVAGKPLTNSRAYAAGSRPPAQASAGKIGGSVRSLAIKEKALGPEHPGVAMSLGNYAALLRETARADEAERMEVRAKAIRAKSE